MSNRSAWLRREHLPGVVEAPGSIPSMTIKAKRKTKDFSSVEEVGSLLMLRVEGS